MRSSVRVLGVALISALVSSGCFLASDKKAPRNDIPTVGNSRWAVLKCHYSDAVSVPENADQTLENLFNGTEGVREWFFDISHGKYLPDFEIQNEWKPMNVTLASEKVAPLSRNKRSEECIQAWGIDKTKYAGVVAIFSSVIDSGYSGNVLLDPKAWDVTFAVHEMLHHMGLPHSFDTSDRKAADWSQPGEYFDPFDMMSAMRVRSFRNENGLLAGPELALPFKLDMGWVTAPNDVEIIDARNLTGEPLGVTREITLRSYAALTGSDPLGVCIDLADDDGGFTRYCAEYRVAQGWDRAIGDNGVLIHFLKNGKKRDGKMTIASGMFKAREGYTTHSGRAVFDVKNITAKNATISISY